MANVDPVRDFMDRYRAAFLDRDVAALVDFYGYPLQLVASGPGQPTVSVAGREEWAHTLRRLIGAYRRLRVGAASTGDFHPSGTLPGVWTVRTHWALRSTEGAPIYDFTAVYTVVESTDGLRIVAITHDELPKITAARQER